MRNCSGLGHFDGNSLLQIVGHFPLNDNAVIPSFAEVAPEFGVQLTGAPANENVTVQAWVFLK